MVISGSDSTILEQEVMIRLGFFGLIFVVMALVEWSAPRRERKVGKGKRWFNNIGILMIGNVLIRGAIPLLPVTVAVTASENGWGILNLFALPFLLEIILTILILDLIIFFQHILFHRSGILWRFHRMHHTDLDLDVTSALRFHPVEMIISLGIKISAVIMLGLPPLGVLIFEVILNGMAMFNHANARIPLRADASLRKFIVTPDMHRVHHSVILSENRSNFGFNLSIWDHIFHTYIDQPVQGHTSMKIGINDFRDPSSMTLPWLLTMPFKRSIASSSQSKS
jgi:sterol desaturase/sphingolipid hydroxylase (fatty acid hydroxylase superfamily)